MTEQRKFEFAEIPLESIDIGPAQARSRKVEENTDELAQSIQALGLINPITVYKKKDGRYDLVTGQRRLIAVEKLKWPTISAKVLLYEPSEIEAKAMSLSENIMRIELTLADIKDSIMLLYHRCGANATNISKTLGVPYRIVLDTIKYEALPNELRTMVDSGVVEVEIAKKSVDFSSSADGTVDIKKAIMLAPELKTMVPSQLKKMKEIKEANPSMPPEEMIEEARATPATKRIYVEMLFGEYEALQKLATAKGVPEEELVYNVIRTMLKETGFL